MLTGMTPLHLASYSGNENVVRLLLNSAGVQVEAATTENVGQQQILVILFSWSENNCGIVVHWNK